MTNEEKILEMLTGMQTQMSGMQTQMSGMQTQITEMQTDIKKLDARLDSLESKVDTLTEAHEETRTSVNALLDWAERASNSYDLPLPKFG